MAWQATQENGEFPDFAIQSGAGRCRENNGRNSWFEESLIPELDPFAQDDLCFDPKPPAH